jgi:hypothetical protein
MAFWRRWLGLRRAPSRAEADEPGGASAEPDVISFEEMSRRLASADAAERGSAAVVLSALGSRAAIGPLIRAYVTFGDATLLQALAGYGARVTPVAARQARDLSLSPSHRARLMDVLGASGDPGAVGILKSMAGDYEPGVHVAACAALVRLGDVGGVERLSRDLVGTDVRRRTQALEALRRLDHPAAVAATEEHVQRYLAEGGAVPAKITVSLPLLVQPEAELPRLIAEAIQARPRTLSIVIGPMAALLAEHRREAFMEALPDYRLFYSTLRHTVPEQLEVLDRVRRAAVREPDARIAFIGQLPSPRGTYPLPARILARPPGRRFTVRIVFVGPDEVAIVMEWWHYLQDHPPLQAEFDVLLTNLTFGSGRMTDEERIIYRLAGERRRDEFARALLAHLKAVHGQ